MTDRQQRHIVYSCYYTRNWHGEQFVPEHVFSYQVAGTNMLNNGQRKYTFNEGDFRFVRRNNLVKFMKQPPPDGEFRSVSLYLDQQTLRSFSMEYSIAVTHYKHSESIFQLKPNTLYKTFMESLMPYSEHNETNDGDLVAVKMKEAILLLLKVNPELRDILFDFSEPGKIDLEAFMKKNYHFNVEVKRFAFLTGRSLATFKRDFEKIFHESPSRWLQQRRLQEAHYLISEKGKAPSDIYLDLGFEDLSHFSFAFKKAYGMAPSRL